MLSVSKGTKEVLLIEVNEIKGITEYSGGLMHEEKIKKDINNTNKKTRFIKSIFIITIKVAHYFNFACMNFVRQMHNKIFDVTPATFSESALHIFRYQAENNSVYKKFLQLLDIDTHSINALDKIPFLPVELFKTNTIVTDTVKPDFYFESSGTTRQIRSKHYIAELSLYEESFTKCFNLFYGDIKQYCVVCMLPSYAENKNSSLLYMCNKLIQKSENKQSGFYLNNQKKAAMLITQNENQKKILLGVSYALLDFAEKFPVAVKNTIVMETGGMKGRRNELTRDALHAVLKKAFNVNQIHAEYGMTELLSQAYAEKDGYFFTPPWMQILIRDTKDPFKILAENKTGCINSIDFANIFTCSFIATNDLGKINTGGAFEVLGRYDNSDVRGCNLLME